MKTFKKITVYSLFISLLFLTACDRYDGENDTGYNEYRTYVNENRDNIDSNYDRDWAEIDTEYNRRRTAAETNRDKWDQTRRDEYVQLERDYNATRERHAAERARRTEATEAANRTANTLINVGYNEGLTNVTADNLFAVYENFVNTIDVNKDTYTAEQWTEVEKYWDQLNNRKNEVEPELDAEDNNKIATLKIKYGALKTFNKTSAKTEAKEESKEVKREKQENR